MPAKRRKAKSMPVRRTHKGARRRKTRTMKGKGPVADWLKKAARTVHDFVKEKQLISRGLTAVAPLAGPYSGHIATASKVAHTLGYGKRKRRRHRR